MPLEALLNHVPAALHGEISRSRYVSAKSNDIIVQADDSRKQNDNAHSCYKRLYDAIVEAGRNAVPNETSVEQMRHVKNLWVTGGSAMHVGSLADNHSGKRPTTSVG